jgi:hypothetical protein
MAGRSEDLEVLGRRHGAVPGPLLEPPRRGVAWVAARPDHGHAHTSVTQPGGGVVGERSPEPSALVRRIDASWSALS